MIRLNCFFRIREEKDRNRFLAEARALTEASLKQVGCIAYDIFESATRSDVFLICETWRDDKALADHSASKEFERHVGAMKAISDSKLERFEF